MRFVLSPISAVFILFAVVVYLVSSLRQRMELNKIFAVLLAVSLLAGSFCCCFCFRRGLAYACNMRRMLR